MRISTKGRYGLRVLLDVGRHQDAGPVPLRDISRRQGISRKYLWQVIHPLKAAGVIRSTRGARGGYVLGRPAETISVRDVVAVLEGGDALVLCVDNPRQCERSTYCVAREAWGQVAAKLVAAMEAITLNDLLKRQRDFENAGAVEYDI